MKGNKNLIVENYRQLKKSTKGESIEVVIYQDRCRVSVEKVPYRSLRGKRQRYHYYFNVDFIYYGEPQRTRSRLPLKSGMIYANEIFKVRNTYMEKHNYRLKEVLDV